MPIRTDEQSRYVFDQTEVDPKDSSHVRITFVPKEPADDTVEGSAWVDSVTGAPISAGFKLSKTPIFVECDAADKGAGRDAVCVRGCVEH